MYIIWKDLDTNKKHLNVVTEPKMKIYLAVKGSSLEDADKQLEVFKDKVMNIVNEKLA